MKAWEKVVLAVVFAVCVVVMCGCATPVSPVLTLCQNGEPVVGLNAGANATPGFLENNWGKLLSGAAAAGGIYLVGDHNDWFKSGSASKEVTYAGDGNIVVTGNTDCDIHIDSGNETTGK